MIDQLQKTFKDSFVKELMDGIKSGRTIEQYATQDFEIDDSKLKYISGLYTPIGLQDRMIAALKRDKRHGAEAAIELYKAYKDLNLRIASDESFWAYLCHTELKEFVQIEWPFEKAKNPSNYVLDHYFFRMGYDRNALASLWWGVYLSYDNEREERGEDPYTLTRIFFKNYSEWYGLQLFYVLRMLFSEYWSFLTLIRKSSQAMWTTVVSSSPSISTCLELPSNYHHYRSSSLWMK